MGDNDSVTIISFGSQAMVEMGMTAMTAAGKQQAQAVIEGLRTSGSTNLVDANALALRQASLDVTTRNIQIVLLTDGEPDNAGSVLPSFRRQIKPLEDARAIGRHHGICLSTFGFGFAMNSVSPCAVAVLQLHTRVGLTLCRRNCCWR